MHHLLTAVNDRIGTAPFNLQIGMQSLPIVPFKIQLYMNLPNGAANLPHLMVLRIA